MIKTILHALTERTQQFTILIKMESKKFHIDKNRPKRSFENEPYLTFIFFKIKIKPKY